MRDQIIQWLKDWFEQNGKDCNAVIGISGGKDSSVAAALCVEALGKDRVIGVMMPDGEQKDILDSWKLVHYLDIRHYVVDISSSKEALYKAIYKGMTDFSEFKITDQTKFNLPPRLRMATLYAIAQSNNGRVINTCNLSETLLGWETRWGDAVGDVAPLADLTATEVVQIGKELGLPIDLVEKVPSDGLCGSSDEDKFGFTYAEFDKCIRTGDKPSSIEVQTRMKTMIENSRFKRLPIPKFETSLSYLIGKAID